MNVKIKKLHPSAIIPTYAKTGDAGMDLYATNQSDDDKDRYIEYGTDISMEIPEGFVGLIYPRSSLSNYNLILSNHVGVIDSSYRGEIKFRFKKTDPSCGPSKFYEVGDRIGQIMIVPYPKITFVESEELSETERGVGGYGSSGT
jgi:dUTP pyrophosphatase